MSVVQQFGVFYWKMLKLMSCVKMRKLNIIVICIFCSQDLYRENKKFSE